MPPEPVSSADPPPPAPAAMAEAQPAADSRRATLEHFDEAAKAADLAHLSLTQAGLRDALAGRHQSFDFFGMRSSTIKELQQARRLLRYALDDLEEAIRLFGVETE